MVRINWEEVTAAKDKLLRDGATDTFELVIIIFYYSRSECDKVQVQLGQLEQALYDIVDDQNIKGVFLFDAQIKKPYLRCEGPDRVNALETVPSHGHPNIVLEFDKMSPESRDVWLEITLAGLQHHIRQGV